MGGLIYDSSMKHSLRRQRIFVVIGFLAVAVGWMGYVAVLGFERSSFPGQERTNLVFGIGSVLGYAVLALASWSWFRWIESSPVALPGLSRVLKLFSVGNLLLAVGLSLVGYFWVDQAVTPPYDGHSTIAAAMTYGFECIGFLLVAIAFWDASAQFGTVRPSLSTSEDDLVAV